MIKENQKYLNRLLVILDLIMVLISFLAAWVIRFQMLGKEFEGGYLSMQEYFKPIILVLPLILMTFAAFKLYSPFRYKTFVEEVWSIFRSVLISISTFIVVLYIFKVEDYSRKFVIVFGVCILIFTAIERFIVRRTLRNMRRKGFNQKHVLLVGTSDQTIRLIKRIKRNIHWGYSIIGLIDDGEYSTGQVSDIDKKILASVKNLGSLNRLQEIISSKNIDEVFITLDLKEYHKLGEVIMGCEKHGIRTQIIPDYSKYIPARPNVEDLDGLPVINIRYIPLENIYNKFIKRAMDIVGSGILILLTSPVMLVIAILIRLSSKGPIIYKQERVGLKNKNFTMFKFRSMKMQDPSAEKVEWTTENDPRKTKIGTFIRKTSLDELPQFFNVFMGHMSLIGPRPERPYFVEQFKETIPKYMVKHQIRPGITGWAQVSGLRGDTSIEKRIEYDIYYLENWSLYFDIKILFLTAFKGFVNKNAY